jgi:hypothetical protein
MLPGPLLCCRKMSAFGACAPHRRHCKTDAIDAEGHASKRLLTFIPFDAGCGDRRADWIFGRRKLKLRDDYI